jgi:putative transposase
MQSDAERLLYYQGLQLSPQVIREIEEMRSSSPSRRVSQRGLKNTVVDLPSGTNGSRRTVESYTVEFLFALELKIFGTCYEYFAQVEPKNIVRYGRTSSAHIDFMVFDPGGIRLVECKAQEHLTSLASRKPHEWVVRDGIWTRPALDAWAKDRGLTYEIWSPPEPHGIYQSNLLALGSFLESGACDALSDAMARRINRALMDRPWLLSEVPDQLHGTSLKHALLALAKGRIHGLMKSVPIDEPRRFLLYGSKEQAECCDEFLLSKLRSGLAQPVLSSFLLRARPSDYQAGIRRLERTERMLQSEEPVTRRYRDLVQRVKKAKDQGENELEVCLTHYENSGRRIGQLTSDQENEMAQAIDRYRKDPLLRTKLQAHDALRASCESKGIRPPSRTTFNTRISMQPQLVRAYTVGGYRAFHAAEDAVEPRNRTMRCVVPRLMVHVDSTKFDVRCSPDFLATLGFECPTLYLAMDSATGMPLGRAVMYGAACRNALAVLIRDVLYRQGCLPRYWIVDKGSEYTGAFFAGFCAYAGITHIQPPAGSPRKNSLAENALGRVNAELAHRFLGSTDPDKQGRSVTRRQKSPATACHTYETIVKHLDHYLFEDMASIRHGVSRWSPQEKVEELGELFGNLGLVEVRCIDDFLIATSVPLDRLLEIDTSHGIRYLDRRYVSDDLLQEARLGKPIEMRIDCVDPYRMYVKFARKWVLASASDHLRVEGRDDLDKLFEHLSDASQRSENRSIRERQRIDRQLRTQKANQEAGSTRHLEVLSHPKEEPPKNAKTKSRWGVSQNSKKPFPTEVG